MRKLPSLGRLRGADVPGGLRVALLLALCSAAPGLVAMTGAAAAPLPPGKADAGTTAGGAANTSVAATLEALRAKPGVVVSSQAGWTVVNDRQSNTVWSFTPFGHAAYPSVVKRTLVQREGRMQIEMTTRCESTQAACAKLIDEFSALNAKAGPLLDQRRQDPGAAPTPK